jgi:hypothetical protein
MSKEKIPRRLRRFYRDKEESYSNNYESSEYSDIDFSSSSRLPGMDYEDIDDKNFEEIKKAEKLNLEEKLAMMEVEKFKKKNKRLPNKKEEEKLASSLYEQFKNDPEYNELEDNTERKRSPRERRARRRRGSKEEEKEEETIQTPDISNNPSSGNDIKSLLSDSDPEKKSKDDFDLGLEMGEDDDMSLSDELEDLEDFSLNPKKKKKK